MKKVFKDLLAATIMTRDFDVKLVTATGKEIVLYRDRLYVIEEKESSTEWNFFSEKWAYIHEDSLPIFEPMVGDKDEDGYIWDGEKWIRDNRHFRLYSTTAKRDGKAFFTPMEQTDE